MAEIKLDIGQAVLENAIAVAIAESFTPERREQIIKDVVRAHLTHKESSYDRETILSKLVGQSIREAAVAKTKELVEKMKPEVDKRVEKLLGPTFKAAVFAALDAALAHVVVSNMVIDIKFNPVCDD